MFARLFMFTFVVFIAHDALARPDIQPRIPPHMDRQHEQEVPHTAAFKGMSHDRLIGQPNPDRINA